MATQIGQYRVSAESETYRIFPKGRNGESIPVTRINHFLYLQDLRGGALVVFKHFLHQKKWYWRDSRDARPCSEGAVVQEVARMLFRGDRERARALVRAAVANRPLA